MDTFRKTVTAFIAALALAALPALAIGQEVDDPYLQPDDSWISLSGTAVQADADSFELDYGEGVVTVEMDDWDWYGDNYGVVEGDEVTVYGEVDDDLYEITTIEAERVYVKDLGTYFYAPSSADEETLDAATTHLMVTPVAIGEVAVTGTVTSIDGREFTVDTGVQQLTVDTIFLPYNPMDDKGFQQVDIGDRVSVSGDLDYNFFEGRELHAEALVTLEDTSS